NNSTLRQLVLRIDHQLTSKDTLTGRYLYNYYESPANDSALVFATKPLTYTPGHNLSLSHTHLFSPSLLNQAQFSMSRRTGENLPVWKTSLSDLGMKNVFSNKPLPEFGVSVTGAFSVATTERDTTTPHNYVISDIVRWSKGRHETSMGFEYRRQSLYKNYRWQLDPYMQFNGYATGYGVADFFLGLPWGLTQSAYGEVGQMRAPGYGAFFQDNIRLTPRLMLNVGARFEPFIPYQPVSKPRFSGVPQTWSAFGFDRAAITRRRRAVDELGTPENHPRCACWRRSYFRHGLLCRRRQSRKRLQAGTKEQCI